MRFVMIIEFNDVLQIILFTDICLLWLNEAILRRLHNDEKKNIPSEHFYDAVYLFNFIIYLLYILLPANKSLVLVVFVVDVFFLLLLLLKNMHKMYALLYVHFDLLFVCCARAAIAVLPRILSGL